MPSALKTEEQWEEREREAILDALLSRQKLSAEIYRLRKYLEERLQSPNENDSLVLMGDFNDGPWAETLEEEFLVHNILDEIDFLRTSLEVFQKSLGVTA